MSIENVSKFGALIREDKELQAKLKAAAEAYAGDRKDEAAFFEATLGKVANEAGIPFTLAEAYECESASGGRELDDAELDKVAGGEGTCIVVGLSDGPEAEDNYGQYYACIWFGVSFAL